MERKHQSEQPKVYYRQDFTPHEWDRLCAFGRMTDLLQYVPRKLRALEPGQELWYPDGTEQNSHRAFAVTDRHVGILSRTAWNLYQSEFVHDERMKSTADEVVQHVKAKYEAEDQRQPHQPSDLWNNS